MEPRKELLEEAIKITTGDRNVQYGDPNADFNTTALLWSSYLERVMARQGYEVHIDLASHDIAVMMILLKVSRLGWSPDHKDNWLDIAGYAACGYHCVASTQSPHVVPEVINVEYNSEYFTFIYNKAPQLKIHMGNTLVKEFVEADPQKRARIFDELGVTNVLFAIAFIKWVGLIPEDDTTMSILNWLRAS